MAGERRASRGVDRARLHSRSDRGNRRLLSLSHGSEQTAKIRTRIAKLNRSRKIHAVSVVDPAKVQHHTIPFLEHSRTGTRVRQGAVRPRGHDCLEGWPLETDPAKEGVEVARDLDLRATWPRQRRGLGRRITQPAASLLERCDLHIVLHDTLALDDPFGRDERGTGVGASERCRRRPGQRGRQPVEAADRHRGRLDPDAARAARPQDVGERFVVAPGRHDDREVRSTIGTRRQQAPRGGLIAEVHDEGTLDGRHDDEAGGADKPGEVADVRKMRDDERIDGGGLHPLPDTGETVGGDHRGNHALMSIRGTAAPALLCHGTRRDDREAHDGHEGYLACRFFVSIASS